MKRKTKSVAVRGLSLIMASTMIAAFAVMNADFALSEADARAAVTAGLTDVTGKVDTEKLRAEYYNDWVQPNVQKSDEERWVIVSLEGDSVLDAYNQNGVAGEFSDYVNTTEAKNRIKALDRSQQAFLSRLHTKGVSFQHKYSYTSVENAVAIKIKGSDISTVNAMSEVKCVSSSVSYVTTATEGGGRGAISNNANVYATGIYNSAGLDYKGEGMAVAILDTGLDFSHPAFQNEFENPSSVKINQEAVEGILASGNLHAHDRAPEATIEQFYYGAKVPFAFDYADDDPDVYPAYSSHGTHVAGIVAGKDDSKQVNADDPTETFIGVAPEAQLVICKVFTDDFDSKMIGSADSVDIFAALEDCVTLGVDVINMSLGTTAGFSSEDDLQDGEFLVRQVYEKIENSGISLIVAASNDFSSGFGGGNGTNLTSNPDSGTVGSPSTYASALSVASINGQNSRYMVANRTTAGDESNVAFYLEANDAKGESLDFIQGLYEKTGTDKSKELTLDYVVVGGVGRPANYTSSVRRALQNGNTLALVKRGDISFAEKVQNAMDNGAVGIIIYNNLSGSIRMSLGDVKDPIPTCSITMDAGNMLVNGATRSVGTVTLSYGYSAGPFMSDFSSWGPTPDLKLKPEITAHGGEITSAVPGGYGEFSGTSMATPNMSGAVALLRQHVQANHLFDNLSGAEQNRAIRAHANRILMSTAAMALNEEGNPYSPRKQGAGLASIADAINTESYLSVSDGNGGVSDKSKIELGDDKEKTGVYVLNFSVNNFSDKTATYQPNVYVFTETVSSDEKTVAEKAYMLNRYSTIVIEAGNGAVAEGGTVSVPAGQKVDITVTITLNAEAKKYIDDNFVNGMYVEGFVRLEKTGETKVSLGLPYLAFYGDWTDAPLFDYSVYEIAESEKEAVEDEDILKASAAATRPLGLYNDAQYTIPLGTYLYEMDEFDTDIYASEEKACISTYDEVNRRTVYQLYAIYAGLLRGAKTMQVELKDAVTGELVYSNLEKNVRKSYAAGGTNRGATVMLEINPMSWGMSNNKKYNLTLSGTLDYEGGDKPANGTFSFSFTVDTEAPVIRDYRIRFEPYTENKETKYRIYMDVDVYDNQFAMEVLPCYRNNNNQLTLITHYPIPVYSDRGTQSTVSFEITDFYEDYVKAGKLMLAVEDYAMNQTVYEVSAAAATDYPDKVTFATDDKLTLAQEGNYNTYDLTIAHNEVYKLTMNALPDDTVAASLEWNSLRGNVARAKDNEIFGAGNGTTTINLRDNDTDRKIKARINVTVTGTVDLPVTERLLFKPVIGGGEYLTDPNSGEIELKPNQTVTFGVDNEPWYSTVAQYAWSSSNEDIFTVDQQGNVVTKRKGAAYLTVSAVGYDRLSKSVRIVVGDEYDVTNNTLYHYYGGEIAVIPEDKSILYLNKDAFRGNTVVKEIVIPSTLAEIPEGAFSGCTNLEKVTIPAKCNIVGNYAFSAIVDDGKSYGACTSLKTVVFEKAEDEITKEPTNGAVTLGEYAFAGCGELEEIVHSKRITAAFEGAFYLCESLEEIDISNLRIGGDYVFAGCTKLSEVTTEEDTYIGRYMFMGCTALTSFEYKSRRLSDYAFYNCSNLETVTFTNSLYYFGDGAFGGEYPNPAQGANNKLTSITLPNGTYSLGKQAFLNCIALETVTLSAGTVISGVSDSVFQGCSSFANFALNGNTDYTVNNGVLYKDSATIVLVPTQKTGVSFGGVTKICDGAFAGNADTALTLPSTVTEIGKYAFANSRISSVDLSGLANHKVPEGAFRYCNAITTITGTNVLTEIGAYAFQGALLTGNQSVDLSSVTQIGDYAFANCLALKEVTNTNSVAKIGAHAFDGCDLSGAVSFGGVTEVGDYAFAQNMQMTSVAFGGVTKMGEGVFSVKVRNRNNQPALTTVTFGNGTTVIGNNAFECIYVFNQLGEEMNEYTDRTNLTTVNVPSSTETIGAYAFVYCINLLDDGLHLGGVKTISDYAFIACEKLEELDLSSVERIGDEALEMTEKLQEANLPNVKTIGAYAFAGSGISELSIPKAEAIDTLAFSNTKLTSVTVPNQSELVYEEERTKVSDSGRIVPAPGKYAARYAAGIFADVPTLTEIRVSGEGKFRSIDGVLYSEAPNGLTLEQYPAAKAGTAYTPAADTVRIADFAFANTRNLESVVIPYTVETIGSQAFFNNLPGNVYVKNFTFESVEAPTLEAAYSMDNLLSDAAYLQGVFYCNFRSYVSLTFQDVTSYQGEAFNLGLSITRPENGVGYDSPVWKGFFHKETLSDYAPAKITRRTVEAIENLPSVEAIKAITTVDGIRAMSADVVQPARKLYNQITEEKQREFVTNYQKLLDVEQAVREVKAALGIPAVMTELKMASRPNKISYYDGERFDPTGMVIKAIYDDLSEIIVTDYTVNVDVLHVGDDPTVSAVTVIISYGGLTCSIDVAVSYPPEPEVPPEEGGLSAGAIAGIVIGSVLGAGAIAAVVVILVLRMKKKAAVGTEEAKAEESVTEVPAEEGKAEPQETQEKDEEKDD